MSELRHEIRAASSSLLSLSLLAAAPDFAFLEDVGQPRASSVGTVRYYL